MNSEKKSTVNTVTDGKDFVDIRVSASVALSDPEHPLLRFGKGVKESDNPDETGFYDKQVDVYGPACGGGIVGSVYAGSAVTDEDMCKSNKYVLSHAYRTDAYIYDAERWEFTCAKCGRSYVYMCACYRVQRRVLRYDFSRRTESKQKEIARQYDDILSKQNTRKQKKDDQKEPQSPTSKKHKTEEKDQKT